MPERATDAEFHERAVQAGYAINVLPQPPRTSVNGHEIVEVEGGWQWNIRLRGHTNIATGHSCGTPQIAFDRALAKLRELVAAAEQAPAPLTQQASQVGSPSSSRLTFASLNDAWSELLRGVTVTT